MLARKAKKPWRDVVTTAGLLLSVAAGAAAAGGCSGLEAGLDPVVAASVPNVRWSQPRQTIAGFGMNTAWLSPPSDATAKTQLYDALFSISKGAGLSIVRHRIPFSEKPTQDDKFLLKNPDGTYQTTTNADGSKTFALDWSSWELENTAQLIADIKAQGADYQVPTFISAPWTPPNNSVAKWKVPDPISPSIDYENAPEIGGTLSPAFYADYADVLADYALGYAAKMKLELSVLSLQNEPNFKCDYQSANWTADQFHDFFAVLKTELTKKGVFAKLPNLKIIAPEYQNVKEDLILPTLNDPETAAILGIVGVHQYEYGKGRDASYTVPVLSKSLELGKPIWQTEWNSSEWGTDLTMANGLVLAKLIHMDLTAGSMNAFLYWWGWGDGKGTLVVVDGSTVIVPKSVWVLGQWSRFVRPDYVRVDTVAKPAKDVLLSAFKNPAGTEVVVVVVNARSSDVTLTLWLDAGSFGPLTVYRTSAADEENLAKVGTLDGGGAVTVTLPATSVTTFVGSVTP
jgi:glucuronoarabinoxylan endo-1,4-beta-xylanase